MNRIREARSNVLESNDRLEHSIDEFVHKIDDVIGRLDRSRERVDQLRDKFGEIRERLDFGVRKADELVEHMKEPIRQAVDSKAIRAVREHPKVFVGAALCAFAAVVLLTRSGVIPRERIREVFI